MQYNSVKTILPEIILLLSVTIIWINSLLGKKQTNFNYFVSIIFPLISACFLINNMQNKNLQYYFSNMYVVDYFSNLIKTIISISFSISIIYSKKYLKDRYLLNEGFFILSIFMLLGQFIMISGNNLLILYLGIELMSLSLYTMIALYKYNSNASEASIKYYILGTIASAFLLYGISIIYALTESFYLYDVYKFISKTPNNFIILFGLCFIMAGMLFKIGLVPFHMWIPDIYEGSPSPVTLMISSIAKITAFSWALRILNYSLFILPMYWQKIFMIFCVCSIVIGSFTGIIQNNIKRMLAYSSIFNMGFMLMGLLFINNDSTIIDISHFYGITIFYTIIYIISILGSFGVIIILEEKKDELNSINNLKGLNEKNPILAFIMMIMMLSLSGIPPIAGFYAKINILQIIISNNFIWLSILMITLSVVSAFYYIRIIKIMYFDKPENNSLINTRFVNKVLLTINGIILILIGINPDNLMSICISAASSILLF